MPILIEALAKWRGREYVDDAISRRGFQVQRLYEQEVRAVCERTFEESPTGLSAYWTELARETVCSANRADPIFRRLPPEAAYRSILLDRLAQRYSQAPIHSLHP